MAVECASQWRGSVTMKTTAGTTVTSSTSTALTQSAESTAASATLDYQSPWKVVSIIDKGVMLMPTAKSLYKTKNAEV